MTTNQFTSNRISSVFSLIRQSLNGEQQVYTTGSIRRCKLPDSRTPALALVPKQKLMKVTIKPIKPVVHFA